MRTGNIYEVTSLITHRSKRFKKGVANLENIVRAYQAILELPTFIEALTSAAEGQPELQALLVETYVRPLHDSHTALKPYSDLVETTVDLEELNKCVVRMILAATGDDMRTATTT